MDFENLPRGKQSLVDADGDVLKIGSDGGIATQEESIVNLEAGNQFSIFHQFTDVSSGSSVNMAINTGSSDILFEAAIYAGGATQAQLQEGTTFNSLGTELSPDNRNRTSSNTANASVYYGNDINELNNTIGGMLIPSGATKFSAIGGEAKLATPYILKADTNHVLKAVNQTSSDSFDIFMQFYWTQLS